MNRLIGSWNSKSELSGVALKCLMVLPAILLQKPSRTSKSKDHTIALKRRLILWKKGEILPLLEESETIQQRLINSISKNSSESISKKFASLMKQGKVNPAVKLLTSNMQGGILPLNAETMSLLESKHPEPSPLDESALHDFEMPPVHSVVFEEISADSVRAAALQTKGGAGPSGVDADGWRHIFVSRNYGAASEDLRSEFARMIKILCTEKVDIFTANGHTNSNLEAFLACRLLPLDKCPGLRPIGVGEVLRRIAGKVVMSVIKGDVQKSVGSLQVCAGQAGGCEAAIHAMHTIFEESENDAVLLIDAANAFNSINRSTMLENIRRSCPIAYVYAFNCYATQARLFVVGGKEIKSREGTTQGDPPSMAFYALGLMPLLWSLSDSAREDKQVAYADDLTGGGKLRHLRSWLDTIVERGPSSGYYAEPSKSWLIVKEEKLEEARSIFDGTSVNITTSGKKHLGAVIGHTDYKREFVNNLVKEWVDQIQTLSEIARYEPHAAYTAFTSCLRHRYTSYMRTIPQISDYLEPLEKAIRNSLIPALTDGRSVTDDERMLLSLPARLGGMGLIVPEQLADQEHTFSKDVTSILTNAIILQQKDLPADFDSRSKEAKSRVRSLRRNQQKELLTELQSRMSMEQKRANDIACETGASNWLTTLPFEERGFHLNKQEFWDAIRLRFGWPITRLPSKCPCGAAFDISHSLSCKKGGFITQRHNEVRDITADLLSEVCKDVCIEPPLQELTGEHLSYKTANISPEARLDVCARGVWSTNQRAFFDVRVFDPNARRFRGQTLPDTYRSNEREKKRGYNERVLQVENGTFTPLVFSVHGGMGQECRVFYKRLSSMIAEKRGEKLSSVSTWIRTRISFALLRSALMCLRGSRSRYFKSNIPDVDMELEMSESTVRAI